MFGYDINGAAKSLLQLSAELEDGKRTLSRYYFETALRLPHANGWWAKKLLNKNASSTLINPHEIRARPADDFGRRGARWG
jgi:hypothetical protein